jgi:hypothetical protein
MRFPKTENSYVFTSAKQFSLSLRPSTVSFVVIRQEDKPTSRVSLHQGHVHRAAVLQHPV